MLRKKYHARISLNNLLIRKLKYSMNNSPKLSKLNFKMDYDKIKISKEMIEMKRFYNENGYYRAADLLRVLGDSCRGVVISDREEVKRSFLEKCVLT